MKKEKFIKSKGSRESILLATNFYGLTDKDLTDKAKLDAANIRLNADLALLKRHGSAGQESYLQSLQQSYRFQSVVKEYKCKL